MTSSTFARDSRHAVRALLRTPAFTAIAALTFALGIGVNTAVFSVFNGVLLRPLPYPEPDRITMVWMDNRQQGIKEDITSWPNYRDWRDQSSSFAAMAGFSGAAFNLTGAEEPERLQGAQTTANFFDVMGVRPLMGRLYTEANETPGNDGVVLISYGLWQRRFGGAGDVLGKTMTLNGRAVRNHRRHAGDPASAGRSAALEAAGARRGDAQGARCVLAAGDRPVEARDPGGTGADGDDRDRRHASNRPTRPIRASASTSSRSTVSSWATSSVLSWSCSHRSASCC